MSTLTTGSSNQTSSAWPPTPMAALTATKPYVSGAAYINRMSNFCGHCQYDPKKSDRRRLMPVHIPLLDLPRTERAHSRRKLPPQDALHHAPPQARIRARSAPCARRRSRRSSAVIRPAYLLAPTCSSVPPAEALSRPAPPGIPRFLLASRTAPPPAAPGAHSLPASASR